MAFINLRWPLKIRADGARAIPMFDTAVTRADSGFEQRNARWDYPLHRFEFSMPPNKYSDADLLLVEQLFYGARGQKDTFLFRYWRDTPAVDEPIAAGDGTTTEFQLVRHATRRIARPLPGVVIKVGGVVTAADIDDATGLITFAAAPADGAAITWSGGNDVEVRFGNDDLSFLPYGGKIAAEEVVLIEVFE